MIYYILGCGTKKLVHSFFCNKINPKLQELRTECRQSGHSLIFVKKYPRVIKVLTKKSNEGRNKIEFNSLEDLVPQDHLLRKIENELDLNFIYDEVAEL